MNNFSIKLLVSLLVSFLMAGCASYTYVDAPSTMGFVYSKYAVLGYEQSLLPLNEVGIITTDGQIRINTVDGKPIDGLRTYKTTGFYSGGRYQLHLLPGKHILTMGFSQDNGSGIRSWSISDITKTMEIKANDIQHLSVGWAGSKWTANITNGTAARPAIEKDFNELYARSK